MSTAEGCLRAHLYLQEHPSMFLPATIPSILGSVPVVQSAETDKALDKDGSRGTFGLHDRIIRIHRKMPTLSQKQTLGHEVMHVILEDSGLSHMVDSKLEEALCDAFGTWFANAVHSGKLVIQD
jgi:hypothetical protein